MIQVKCDLGFRGGGGGDHKVLHKNRASRSASHLDLSSCCNRNDRTTGVASTPCSGKGEKSLVLARA